MRERDVHRSGLPCDQRGRHSETHRASPEETLLPLPVSEDLADSLVLAIQTAEMRTCVKGRCITMEGKPLRRLEHFCERVVIFQAEVIG